MERTEYEAMLGQDERHWWYRGRRRVLAAVIGSLDLPASSRVLDAGCGSGRTLDDLAALGEAHGAEPSPLGVEAARRRGHVVRRAPVEELPFEDAAFDLVTCLDVIEHTPDDERALRELRRVTRPDGALVVTVPAYPALWSAHDVSNRHYRRYTRAALRTAARASGWRVERETGFNAAYLAPAAAVRLARRRAPAAATAEPASELALTPPALNGLLEAPLRLEASLIARGRDLPAGLSLLAVLRPR
jgi:SAM-dependent methyltransferase